MINIAAPSRRRGSPHLQEERQGVQDPRSLGTAIGSSGWYEQNAPRERPGGYSTIAPIAAARLSLGLQELNCGDWRPGTDDLLRRLGVRHVAFHRGLSGPREWFAWRVLREHGFGQLARDGAISVLALSIDRRPVRSLRLTGPASLPLQPGRGWHVIGVNVDRADRGLQVRPLPP
jgi:hypothetical protein